MPKYSFYSYFWSNYYFFYVRNFHGICILLFKTMKRTLYFKQSMRMCGKCKNLQFCKTTLVFHMLLILYFIDGIYFILIFLHVQIVCFILILFCRRPSGSEFKVATGLEGTKPRNPDHVGGYSVAIPIFSGIESKFGLCFPKFSVAKQ